MPNDQLLMKVRAALARVIDPARGRDIVTTGLVSDLSATEAGVVRFTLAGDDGLLDAARAAAGAVEGVSRVAAFAPKAEGPAGAPAPGHDNPFGLARRARPGAGRDGLAEVGAVIAIASGKGGVGKSTIAANLAVALAADGLRIGLLDADIYGPSLPTLFGLTGKPPLQDGLIVPVEAFGVLAMSIGLLVDPDKALAWRGPMVMGAVRQLMNDVLWGPLDALLIDTPPGTGDVHLTLAQSKKLTGAVIVSTPQEMALADVRRGVALFRTVQAPILGVIENMAHIDLPDGGRLHPFGEGGARREAQALDAPFLGALALDPALRMASDAGRPLVATAPDAPVSQAIRRAAATLAERIRG